MSPRKKEDWVRIAVERFARTTEEYRQHEVFGTGDEPGIRVIGAVAAWGSRYQTRREQIGSVRTVDPWLVEAVEARGRAFDASLPGEPDWPEACRPFTHGSTMTRWTRIAEGEPHPHGPSLRRLWLEAERGGADLDGILDALVAWGNAPTRPLAPEATAWLGKDLAWELSGDEALPWRATSDGKALALRLEDFPEVAPWTLLVDGEPTGAVYTWPEGWTRGEPVAPEAPAVVGEAAGRWLERYQAGEHAAVWEELREARERVRRQEWLPIARSVAAQTMKRLRHDLDLLLPRLEAAGYAFGAQPTKPGRSFMQIGPLGVRIPLPRFGGGPTQPPPPFTAPRARDLEAVREYAREGLVLPLSLEAFVARVGAVDLIGQHPVLNPDGARDPLALFPFAEDWSDALAEAFEHWQEAGEPVELPLSLPADDKAATARGEDPPWDAPIELLVPTTGADARLAGTDVWFVDWLRRAMAGGGFAGWAEGPRPAEVVALTEGFVGF